MTSAMAANDTDLSADQAAVYDRQLRVWGVEVQRKLTASRVLLLGFGQLAAEDGLGVAPAAEWQPNRRSTPATSPLLLTAALGTCCRAASVAAGALQAMNPLVKVVAAPGSVASSSSVDQLKGFDLVVAAGLPLLHAQQLDERCSQAGVCFMAAAAPGPGGYYFLNLHEHSYMPKKAAGDNNALAAAPLEPQVLHYVPLADALSVDVGSLPSSSHPLYLVLQVVLRQEQQLGRPLTPADAAAAQAALQQAAAAAGRTLNPAHEQMLGALVQQLPEFAPVCAVLGGVVANNIIRTVSHSGPPLKNLFYYTLFDGQQGLVEDLPPPANSKAAAEQQHKAAARNGNNSHPWQAAAAAEVHEID